jgi:hypothetical protein
MQKYLMGFFIVLIMAVLAGTAGAKDDWTLYPGQGIGSMKLGMPFAEVEKHLGKSYWTKAESETRVMKNYKALGVLFFIDGKNRVTEIYVLKAGNGSATYETAGHAKVGCTIKDVLAGLGNPLESQEKKLTYKGIEFTFDRAGKCDSIRITR